MQYRIHGQDVKITASLKRETERHLRFALSRFSPSIEQVGVRLIDVNGPGEVGKRCRIVVTMKDADTIVVEAEDAMMSAAISAAADRMERTIARAARRRREAGQRAGLYEFGETPPQTGVRVKGPNSGGAKRLGRAENPREWGYGKAMSHGKPN